jgi:glutamine synthetase
LASGVKTLPAFRKDSTDRNRTSPFAFTGNKFEFRMVASSQSISGPNVVLNLIIGEVLSQFSDRLEKAADFEQELQAILKETATKHKRILFDGNGYAEEWVEEAAKRGLPNVTSTVEAALILLRESTVKLYEKHKVLSRTELESRFEINLEQYSKQINIEALTMINMAKNLIVPAAVKYSTQLATSINAIKSASSAADVSVQEELLKEVCSTLVSFNAKLITLEKSTQEATALTDDAYAQSVCYRDVVFTAMQALRIDGDHLETMIDAEIWPLPTYAQMLFML